MDAKRIITLVLLVFVAASAVAIVMKGSSGDSKDDVAAGIEAEGTAESVEKATESAEKAAESAAEISEPADSTAGSAEDTAGSPAEPGAGVNGPDTKVIAYYFHGNRRCKTCLTIEMYALEALETGFPEAMADGTLEFLPVNLETADNEHFIDDFNLSARTVILERIEEGKRGEFVNLHRVWELVRDKEAFTSYVQDETEKFINGES